MFGLVGYYTTESSTLFQRQYMHARLTVVEASAKAVFS
jgi:hypothetical protein